MAKIRGIKPEFWTDDALAEATPWTRLFYIGLWSFADDNGVFKWNAKRLNALIFPYEKVAINKCLQQLLDARKIASFKYEGEKYGIILNFAKHQNVDKRWFKAILPLEDIILDEYTASPHGGHGADIELNGIDVDIELNSTAQKCANAQNFDKFWREYPKKRDKSKAKKAFNRISTKLFDEIMCALQLQKQSDQWLRDDGQFIPYPTTWLNGRRWEDQLESDGEKVYFDNVKI